MVINYQDKAAAQAVLYTVYAVSCAALGDLRGTLDWGKAAAAYAVLAAVSGGAKRLRLVNQMQLNETWPGPIDDPWDVLSYY